MSERFVAKPLPIDPIRANVASRDREERFWYRWSNNSTYLENICWTSLLIRWKTLLAFSTSDQWFVLVVQSLALAHRSEWNDEANRHSRMEILPYFADSTVEEVQRVVRSLCLCSNLKILVHWSTCVSIWIADDCVLWPSIVFHRSVDDRDRVLNISSPIRSVRIPRWHRDAKDIDDSPPLSPLHFTSSHRPFLYRWNNF